MDFACCLRSLSIQLNSPGAGFHFAGSQEGHQAKQLEACFNQAVQTGFLQTCHFQIFLSLFFRKLGNFAFHLSGNNDNLSIFFCSIFLYSLYMLVTGRIGNLALGNVGNVQYRFHSQQMQLAQELLLFLGQTKAACRHTIRKAGHNLFHYSLLQLNLFIAGFCQLNQALLTFFNCFHISQAQLGVDNIDITQRINAALNVGNVAILKAAYNLGNSVYLTDMGQELIAQAFALACALYQTGNIYKTHSCRNNLFGFKHVAQNI